MVLLLAGDIGGTKTILRLVQGEMGSGDRLFRLVPRYEARYLSGHYPSLVPLVRDFLAAAAQETGETLHPQRACFAIAGPVVNNTCKLTNLPWDLDGDRLSKELGIDQVTLINDFAAVGYGVLGLEPSDLHTLQVGEPQAHAPIGVIGAGTGLGEGFLIPQGDDYQIYPSEGGHADFAPRSELEFQLLKYLLDKHNILRVSVERVVSGQGVVAIYQFLRDRGSANESPDVAQAVRTWEAEAGQTEKSTDPAAAISLAALAGRDPLSEQAMQLFVQAYGAEAGNLALKLLPYGGLYIAGGIAAKNLPLLQQGDFLRSLNDKGRISSLIKKVPVHVILNPQVGLIGAALYAARRT